MNLLHKVRKFMRQKESYNAGVGKIFICVIATFTVFTDSYVSWHLSFSTCALISVNSLFNEVDLHKWYYFTRPCYA